MVGARFLTVEKEIYRSAKRANGSDPSYHSGLELETSGRTHVCRINTDVCLGLFTDVHTGQCTEQSYTQPVS